MMRKVGTEFVTKYNERTKGLGEAPAADPNTAPEDAPAAPGLGGPSAPGTNTAAPAPPPSVPPPPDEPSPEPAPETIREVVKAAVAIASGGVAALQTRFLTRLPGQDTNDPVVKTERNTESLARTSERSQRILANIEQVLRRRPAGSGDITIVTGALA